MSRPLRILLISPSQHCREGGRRDRVPLRFGRTANLSVMQVAACTPAEHSIEIVDDRFEEPDYGGAYDLVGLTAMSSQSGRAYEIAAGFRRRGIPVVMGGYHATFCPDDAARHCDAVVIGEAEPVWDGLLRDLRNGRLARTYRADRFAAPETLPVPRYDLMQARGYRYLAWPVQATRGCPLACSFCSVTQFFRRSYRMRPVEHVVASVRAIPSRRLFFVDDDLFIGNRRYLYRMFEAIEPLDRIWYAQTDLRSADNDELLERAHRAGCRGLYIGFESFNPDNLASVNKSRSNRVEEYARIIGRIHRRGIGITASLIVGLDHDREEHYAEVLRLLEEWRIEELSAYIVTPLPGTPMTGRLEQEQRVLSRDFALYDGTRQLVRHPHFGDRGIEEVYWRLMRRFYSWRSTARRYRTLGADPRTRINAMLYNLLITRYWVRRRVHPYIANGFPFWLALLLKIRDAVRIRVRHRMEPPPSPERSIAA